MTTPITATVPISHHAARACGYGDRMPSRPSGIQLGLFDNPVRVFSLEELTGIVRKIERQHPGQTVGDISAALFAELGMKRTPRARDIVAEAIRIARQNKSRADISGSRSQASTTEARDWASANGFQIGADGTIPAPAISAYNQTHPDRPY